MMNTNPDRSIVGNYLNVYSIYSNKQPQLLDIDMRTLRPDYESQAKKSLEKKYSTGLEYELLETGTNTGTETEKLEVYKEYYKRRIEDHKKEYNAKRQEEITYAVQGLKQPRKAYITLKKKIKYAIDDFIFVKKSLGKDGKPIDVYKLQTMVPGTDYMFNEIATIFGLDDKGNLKYDPRITRIGAFERKFWIDELPQIYNLLRGDIKLVGPRPMSEKHWNQYSFKGRALKIKPGMLGVNYAKKEEESLDECMNKYFDEYDAHPIKTDLKYALIKIPHNILIKGVRSS